MMRLNSMRGGWAMILHELRAKGLLFIVTCLIVTSAVGCGSGGGSNNSTPSSDTSDTSAPSIPTGLTAVAIGANSINLTWTASTDNVGVTVYWVYRGGVRVSISSTTAYTDTALASNTTYTYAVAAYDAAGNGSAQSTSASATTSGTSDTNAPSIPTGLTAVAGSSTLINLTWNASTDDVGVTGYKIYRGGVQTATSTTNGYSDTGLVSNTTYIYTVSAYDAAGNNSAQSTSANATTSVPAASTVIASGIITFDFVPTNSTNGLMYANTTQKPARGIIIEAINLADSSILDTTSTDGSGNYSVNVPTNTNMKIRIKAQMLKTGTPSWDFQVVDNTSSQALYLADSVSFNSGTSNVTKSYNLPSGWGGASYTSTRVAAPFAILDTVYKAMSKISSADNTVHFPQLLINWSLNNIGTTGATTLGQIGTSHYSFADKQLYILGKADNDTDEYDDHVIAHEWGHYFEANFSRSDSPGGSHSAGDKLDPRLAFGEGFGNAFSGMATDDPHYIDTNGTAQSTVGVVMNLSSSNGDPNSIGWYSEDSVQYILYSLYNNLGFSPLYSVFTNQEKASSSFTTIYSFITYLKANNPSSVTMINTLLSAKNISTSFADAWDSTKTETNNGGDSKALPVFTVLTVGAPAVQVCGNDEFDNNGDGNKLMSRRFIAFQITNSASYTVSVSPVTVGGIPDFFIYLKGGNPPIIETNNSSAVTLTQTQTLSPATYTGEVFDLRHYQGTTYLVGEVCFNVRVY